MSPFPAFRSSGHAHGPQLASSVSKSRMPTVPSLSKSGGPPGSRDREQGSGCHIRVAADRVAIWCAIRPKATLAAPSFVIAVGLRIRCSPPVAQDPCICASRGLASKQPIQTLDELLHTVARQIQSSVPAQALDDLVSAHSVELCDPTITATSKVVAELTLHRSA